MELPPPPQPVVKNIKDQQFTTAAAEFDRLFTLRANTSQKNVEEVELDPKDPSALDQLVKSLSAKDITYSLNTTDISKVHDINATIRGHIINFFDLQPIGPEIHLTPVLSLHNPMEVTFFGQSDQGKEKVARISPLNQEEPIEVLNSDIEVTDIKFSLLREDVEVMFDSELFICSLSSTLEIDTENMTIQATTLFEAIPANPTNYDRVREEVNPEILRVIPHRTIGDLCMGLLEVYAEEKYPRG